MPTINISSGPQYIFTNVFVLKVEKKHYLMRNRTISRNTNPFLFNATYIL